MYILVEILNNTYIEIHNNKAKISHSSLTKHRPNYNCRSSDESPDISAHCPSTCRADLTKWLDENAPVALAVVKRDPKKSQANAKW